MPIEPQLGLTRREEQVYRLALHGYPTKEIADKLGITPRTAKFHLTAIYRKVQVSNHLELIARARLDGRGVK
ncbi:MAG: helix-turn-helix transcriptional regulator [Bryobacteraceae bacterium]